MDQFDEVSELEAHMARRRAEQAAGAAPITAAYDEPLQRQLAQNTSDLAAQLAAADAVADSSDDALRAHIEARRRQAQACADAVAGDAGSVETAGARSQLLEDLFSSCQAVPVLVTPAAPAAPAVPAAAAHSSSLAATLAAFDAARGGAPLAAVEPEPSTLPAGTPAELREETAVLRKQVEHELNVFRHAFIPGFTTELTVAENHVAAGGRLLGSALQVTAALRQRQQLLETGLAGRQTVPALARLDALEAILAGRETGGLQLPAPLLNHSAMRAFAGRMRDDVAALRAEVAALTQMFARVGLAVHDIADPALKLASAAFAQLTLLTAEIQPTLRLMRAQLEKHRISTPTMEEVFAKRPVVTTSGQVVAEHAGDLPGRASHLARGPARPPGRGPPGRGPPGPSGPAAAAAASADAAAEAAAVAAAARAYAGVVSAAAADTAADAADTAADNVV